MSSNERFSDTGSGGTGSDGGSLRDSATEAFRRLRDRVSGGGGSSDDSGGDDSETDTQASRGAQRAVDRTPEPDDQTRPADPTDEPENGAERGAQRAVDQTPTRTGSDSGGNGGRSQTTDSGGEDSTTTTSEDVRQQAIQAERQANRPTGDNTIRPDQEVINASVAEVNERVSQKQQGVERGSARVGQQAQDLEQQVLDDNPGLRAEDVRVRRDGDTLRTELTPAGRRRFRNQQEQAFVERVAAQNENLSPEDLVAVRNGDSVSVGLSASARAERAGDRLGELGALIGTIGQDVLDGPDELTPAEQMDANEERIRRISSAQSRAERRERQVVGEDGEFGLDDIENLDRETQQRVNEALVGQRSRQLSAAERREDQRQQEGAGDFRLDFGGVGDVADETATQFDIARRQLSGASVEGGRLQTADAPRRELDVLDTDFTLEGVTQGAAEGVSAGIEDVSRETVSQFSLAGQQIEGAGVEDGRLTLGDATRPSAAALDDSTAVATLRTLGELGNVPAAFRSVDEIAFEPAVETAFDDEFGQTEAGALTIADLTQRRAEAAFDRNFAFDVNEQRVAEVQRGNLTGSDDPLFDLEVRPERRDEVAGAAYGGVLSLGVSGGAISGASRLSPGAGRAVAVGIQPGEEAAIAAARRGLITDRTARFVPGVRQNQIEFGSGPDGAEIRARDFSLDDDANLDLGFIRGDRGQLELTGRQRQRPDPDADRREPNRRTVTDDFEVSELDLERATRRETTVDSGPVRMDGETTVPSFPERRAEIASGPAERQEQAERSSFDIDEQVFGGRIAEEVAQDTGIELDQEQATRPELELDLGIETRTDVRTELDTLTETETRLDTRTETRTDTRVDTRQDVRTETAIEQELRQELGLETPTELSAESEFPKFEDSRNQDDDRPPRFSLLDETFSSGFISGEELLEEIRDS